MGRSRCKPRMIPEQDRRICGGICLCQLTVVFSCVALVYLTVVIYIPSHRAFNSGFEMTPVMCQSINTTMENNCNWASCGEWCLTKTSGFCPQIHVTVRRNGTDIILENCTRLSITSCPPVSMQMMKKFNCNNGSECSSLSGLFNCTLGHCSNMSEVYLCHYKADGFVIDSEKDNTKLNGFFECHHSRCTKIKRAFSCDRYCKKITTSSINVYLAYDDNLYTAQCKQAFATVSTNGSEVGQVIDPTLFWDDQEGEILLASCHTVSSIGTTLKATDCINGTLLKPEDIPDTDMNFTTYWDIYNRSKRLVDPQMKFLPLQPVLTIYNNSRLYINLDGCVNTLQGECREFLHTHGRDGKNQTAQSRFPCFYNKNDSFFVIARFDLTKTWRELIIAISIPSVLFVISFITLCIITQSVKVGDDAKMRCKCCVRNNDFGYADRSAAAANCKYAMPSGEEQTPDM